MPADFNDRTDFENADRGFIASIEPMEISDDTGRRVWDNDAYAFLSGDRPDTANPSLWRQAQFIARHGLFEVTPRDLPGARTGHIQHDLCRGGPG